MVTGRHFILNGRGFRDDNSRFFISFLVLPKERGAWGEFEIYFDVNQEN